MTLPLKGIYQNGHGSGVLKAMGLYQLLAEIWIDGGVGESEDD